MSFVTQFGSKQYIVEEGQKFAVDRLDKEVGEIFDLPVLYSFGASAATSKVSPKVKVIAHPKGEKLRIVKFKSKNKYHKVNGFRAYLTILKVIAPSQEKKVTAKKTTKAKTEKNIEKA